MLDSPKLEAAGPLAEHLFMRSIIYAARNQTDGLITKVGLRKISDGLPKIPARVLALVDARLWIVEGDSWQISGFLKYNPSKAEIVTRRESDRVRQEVYRTRGLSDRIKKRDGDQCRYCGEDVNWKDRRGMLGAQFEHVIPVSGGGSTTFENLVVSCRGCNLKKAGRTPEQAGMTLIDIFSDDLGSRPRWSGSGRDLHVLPPRDEHDEKSEAPWKKAGLSRAEWQQREAGA